MSRVFFDTNLFIYLFEQAPGLSAKVVSLLKRMDERDDELVTSWMTVAELQIKPKAMGQDALCQHYRHTLQQIATLVVFGEKAADAYLGIRSATSVKGPDAIQLACAAASGVELFITSDLRLQKLTIPGIHFITSLDRVPL